MASSDYVDISKKQAIGDSGRYNKLVSFINKGKLFCDMCSSLYTMQCLYLEFFSFPKKVANVFEFMLS